MKQVDYTLSSELKKILSDKKNNNNLDNITNTLKITLIYKDITQIGEYIPYQFQGVTHLLLSNNKISNLNGIQQFPNLTHFSISFNYIEDIKEFNKIVNKKILLSLSVKGNLFCKNPQSNIKLIKKFPKLKYLDSFKITEATYKVINEKDNVGKLLLFFFDFMNEKIESVRNITQKIRLNNEYYNKVNYFKNNETINEYLNRLRYLLNINNLIDVDNEYISKYLNSSINPSVHIIKKIIGKFIPTDTIPQNFDIKKFKSLYSQIFLEVIQSYESKKNKAELPFYLNYLLVSSSPLFEKFLTEKSKEILSNKATNSQESLNINLITRNEMIDYICKNFNEILTTYSTYTLNEIHKFQFLSFYYMSNGKDDEFINNKENDILQISYNEGKEFIQLDGLIRNTCKFLNEFYCDSFPIFALNFDYMRNIMTIVQNKIKSYILEFYEIKKIFNELFEIKNKNIYLNEPMEKNINLNIKKKNPNKNKSRSLSQKNITNENELPQYNNYNDYENEDLTNYYNPNLNSNILNSNGRVKKKYINKSNSPLQNNNNENNYQTRGFKDTGYGLKLRNNHNNINYNKIKVYRNDTGEELELSNIEKKQLEYENIKNGNSLTNKNNNNQNINNPNESKYIYNPFNQVNYKIDPSNTSQENFSKNSNSFKQSDNNNFINSGFSKNNGEELSNLEISRQNYYNSLSNKNIDDNQNISNLERTRQKYYNLKKNNNDSYQYNYYIPNKNELFTLGQNEKEEKNKKIETKHYNANNNKSNYNNPLVAKLSNIANAISILDYLINKNIYDSFIIQLKFNRLFSNISRFVIRLYRIYIYLSKKKFIHNLKDLKKVSYAFYNIRKKYAKITFLNALKQNFLMCKYEQNLYIRKLKAKSLYGLYNNKLRQLHKKSKDTNALAFYYQTIIKKLFLMLKFNYHNSEKYQKRKLLEYQMQKQKLLNDDSENINKESYDLSNYNNKIFNFFHSNDNENEDEKNDEDFEKYNKMFNQDNLKEIRNKIKEENEISLVSENLKENSTNYNNNNDINHLLSKLENKYNSFVKKSKSKLNVSNLTENKKEKEDNKKGYKRGKSDKMKDYGSQIKYGKKKNTISGVSCPYCSAGIPHNICIGNSSGPIDDVLGAPKFMQRTQNFAHKKL